MDNTSGPNQTLKFAVPKDLKAADERREALVKKLDGIRQDLSLLKTEYGAGKITLAERNAKKSPLLWQFDEVQREIIFLNAFIEEKERDPSDVRLKVLDHFKRGERELIRKEKFVEPSSLADARAQKAEIVAEVKRIELQLSILKSKYVNLRDMTAEESSWRGKALRAKSFKDAKIATLSVWIHGRQELIGNETSDGLDLTNPQDLLKGMFGIIKRRRLWETYTPDEQKIWNAAEKYLLCS